MKSFRGLRSASSGQIVSAIASETCVRPILKPYGFFVGFRLRTRHRLSIQHRSTSQEPYLCRAPGKTRAFHTNSSLSSRPHLSYRIAASCSAKGVRFDPEKNSHPFDPHYQESLTSANQVVDPTTRRRRKAEAGEDAFFVSNVKGDPGAVAFAVADGVGGWAESRVDPGEFSRGLCSSMAEAALSWQDPSERLRPKALLQMAYDRLLEEGTILAGGSTASVGIARRDGIVELANLGDSGSVLLRRGAVHYYSAPQTHAFNTPFQLSIIPPRMRAQTAIFGGVNFEDFPRDATVTTVNMQHGDVLILATDGVFDNLNNQDILKIVSGRMNISGAWTDATDGAIGISPHLGRLTTPQSLNNESTSSTPGSEAPTERSTSPSLSRQPSDPLKKDSTHTPTDPKSRLVTSPATPSSTRNVYRVPNLQTLLAASLVAEAKLASLDMRRDGPFAKEAQRHFPSEWYHGGKVDDITVIVIMAVEEGSQ